MAAMVFPELRAGGVGMDFGDFFSVGIRALLFSFFAKEAVLLALLEIRSDLRDLSIITSKNNVTVGQ
ncbi:MAG: hypothetical protein R6X19_11470 [Kiritimatiellia bacterium]